MDNQSKTESEILRSSIKSEHLTRILKKGGVFGVAGALILVLGGTFLPLESLKIWGTPLFFSGLALIAFGLLPYKRLYQLQIKPHELHCYDQSFVFYRRGRALFIIPCKSIECIKYCKKQHLYGIGIWLKQPIQEPVKVLQRRFDIAGFTAHSQKHFEGSDLFLPYFSQTAHCRLLNLIPLD